MLRAIIVLFLLSVCLIIGYAVQTLPMSVRIYDFANNRYFETPLISWILLSLVCAAVLLICGKFLGFLLRSPEIFSKNAQNRKSYQAHRFLEQGLRSLATGDYSDAEKKLVKGGQIAEQLGLSPVLYYENAALAADRQNNSERRDKYFLLARENSVDKDSLLTKISEAETRIANGEFQVAAQILEKIARQDPKNPKIALLLDSVYPQLGKWTNAWHNLDKIKKQLSNAQFAEKKKSYAKEMLQDTSAVETFEELQTAWKNLPSEIREDREMIVLYAASLSENGHHEEAAKLLASQIKSNPDITLLRAYSDLQGINDARSAENLEAWSKLFGKNPEYLYCRALIALRNNQLAEAEKFISESLNLRETSESLALLGTICDYQKQSAQALKAYRKSVEVQLHLLSKHKEISDTDKKPASKK
ncbi:MAG: heme biosynthesis protein HemY [Cardiobacteriaceae bacterium]|nr:heme biosynthesis protein HemY [Cardiobacteriaceae bacterium]